MFESILPSPLHPAVVHLPIALTLLLPLFAIGGLLAVRRGARPWLAWGVAVGLFALLAASAWVATETGEQQEEAVEEVVGDRPIHSHEEAAETFLYLSIGALAIAALGLRRDGIGRVARGAATVATLGLVAAGWSVGHSGGQLVYRHGAANAYVNNATMTADAGQRERGEADDD